MGHACQWERPNIYNNLPRSLILINFHFGRAVSELLAIRNQCKFRLKDENVEHRRALGVTINSDFDVKQGSYMIRVVARDAEGQQMAAANDTVEIP